MKNLTIKQRLKQLKRRYSKVTRFKFFYNRKSELNARYKKLQTWFLIHDADSGYSVFPFALQRKKYFTLKEWTRLFTKPYQGYNSIYEVLTQAVLPAINVRSGRQWRFISLIGWTGKKDAIRKTKNTDRARTGNKAAKKRNANARNTRRR